MTPARRFTIVALSVVALAAPAIAQPAKIPMPEPPPAVAANNPNNDLAYGAYQRGHYLTAFAEATKRARANDPVAMTLLGELYAHGYGVPRDDAKAAEWYKLAAGHGDRNAMFALAMLNFEGRAGARNLEAAAQL